MEDDGNLILPHFMDVTSLSVPLTSGNLLSEITNIKALNEDSVGNSEANDLLKNGILIETNKG